MMASYWTPLNAQWNLTFSALREEYDGFYFTDSLHGWFTNTIHNTYRLLYTADSSQTFVLLKSPNDVYRLYTVYNCNAKFHI
jgi:hypothetical protein